MNENREKLLIERWETLISCMDIVALLITASLTLCLQTTNFILLFTASFCSPTRSRMDSGVFISIQTGKKNNFEIRMFVRCHELCQYGTTRAWLIWSYLGIQWRRLDFRRLGGQFRGVHFPKADQFCLKGQPIRWGGGGRGVYAHVNIFLPKKLLTIQIKPIRWQHLWPPG